MRGSAVGWSSGALVLLVSTAALAKPKVEVAISSTKQVVTTKDGKQVVRSVAAKDAAPGEVVTYTLTYANKGDESATNAVIVDAIPPGTTYVADSAKGANSEIAFSNDGGKSYAAPVMLFYDYTLPSKKVEKRVATPDRYTHVRWTVKEIPAGASDKLEFKVKIK